MPGRRSRCSAPNWSGSTAGAGRRRGLHAGDGEVAKEKGAGLFRRFEIMRGWYNDGMHYAQFVTSDGPHLNDFGQKCVGKLLSKAILDTIRPKQLTDLPNPRN
jgi:hypothetical protein